MAHSESGRGEFVANRSGGQIRRITGKEARSRGQQTVIAEVRRV